MSSEVFSVLLWVDSWSAGLEDEIENKRRKMNLKSHQELRPATPPLNQAQDLQDLHHWQAQRLVPRRGSQFQKGIVVALSWVGWTTT